MKSYLLVCLLVLIFSIYLSNSGSTNPKVSVKSQNSTNTTNTTKKPKINTDPEQGNETTANDAIKKAKNSTNGTKKASSNDSYSKVIVQFPPAFAVAEENLPNFPGTVVLGKPTNSEITFNVVPNIVIESYNIVVLHSPQNITSIRMTNLKAFVPSEVTVSGLTANSQYFYIISFVINGTTHESPVHYFRTQRASGSTFKFSIIADSHLFTAPHNDVNRYAQTLMNVHNDQPDFVITLGDDFRTTNVKTPISAEDINWLFYGHRAFHNLIARDAPLFLVNGNHEDQSGWLLDGTADNLPLWGAESRLLFYPNPRPNSFYSGNQVVEPFIPDGGLLENYYAWTWGDALFVVLDDYWYSKLGEGQWNCSFGYDQFMWLKNVLSTSTAKFKFIFHHHLICTCRGGAEYAKSFEWGGAAQNGQWQFDQYRPGWGGQSIHQMAIQYKVSMVFQGHDHLYANQEVDGVKYITVPMPAYNPATWATGDNNNADAFLSGIVLGPSGHLTVEVSPYNVDVKYLYVGLQGENVTNMQVADHFVLTA